MSFETRLTKVESLLAGESFRVVADNEDFDEATAKAKHEAALAAMKPGDKVFSVLFGAWTKTRNGNVVRL